jgi:uncharacterized membrane protein
MPSSGSTRTLLDLVHSNLSLRCLSRRERVALGAISLCTLALLAALQYRRVFFGDEIGTLRCLKQSPTYILTHFGTWLSMNYFILVEKGVAWLCGAADWRLTLLPMAAAVAIIPLTASLALKLTGSTRTALIAASLAAFNPYLVMWGPAIRAYSLLVAFALLAINEFFNWARRRDWWSGVRCAAAVLLLLLTHLNGVYIVAFLILLLVAEVISAGWSGGRKFLWESRTLWVPLAGAAVIVAIAYWRLLPDIARINREWGTDTPPTSMAYLPQVFTTYMGFTFATYMGFTFATYMGINYASCLSALLLLAGCWSAAREKRALFLLCGAIILGPILMSLQGVSLRALEYARYLIFSLPLLLILIAEGIDWFARHVWVRRATIVAWSLTALIVVCWTPYIRWQFLVQKTWPYGRVAKFLHTHMQKNDIIVAGWAIGFTLSQFFDDPEHRIVLPDSYLHKTANQLDARLKGRVFYVTGPAIQNGRTASIQRFGQAEVAIYGGDTTRALLEEWREDLLHRTAGRVYGPFQNDYQLLALLEERLPSGQSADHWRSLAERCLAQYLAVLDGPRRRKKATRAVIFL